ncbi:MAG: glycosyltransferase family 1 protein [bacterium]
MKIGIDAREAAGLEKAGKGTYVQELLKEIENSDSPHQFILYTKDQLSVIDSKNIKVKQIKAPSIFWHLVCLWHLLFIDKVDKFLATTSYIIPALVPKKCVVIIPDLVVFLKISQHQTKASLIEKLTLIRAAKKCLKIIAISESTKKDIIKTFSVAQDKIIVILLAASDIFQPTSNMEILQKYSLPFKYFLFVSTLEPRKNIVRLIKAYKIAKSENDFPQLVLVGKKGWYYKEIFVTIENLGLEKDIIFPNYIEACDLPAIYSHATAYLFPSLYEGFGMTVLEAMKCGTPVLTSNISSLPEVVGEAALLVDPKNVTDIAKSIKELYLNENLKNKLVEKGYKQAQKFSWQKTAEETLKVLTHE